MTRLIKTLNELKIARVQNLGDYLCSYLLIFPMTQPLSIIILLICECENEICRWYRGVIFDFTKMREEAPS